MNNRILAVVFLLSFSVLTIAAESDWELRRDREGVQVYTRKLPGSPFDEVRAVTEIENTRLSALVALIEDAEACPRWADRCEKSYIYRRISETEALVYSLNNMPFPVKDRDHLAHVKWRQDPESLAVVMNSVSANDILAEVDRVLRLTEAVVSWHFTPLPSGAIEIMNQAHINPGSSLPGWVTNRLLIDTPFTTMQEFVAEVKKPKYRDAEVGFVQEPPSQQSSR